MYVSQLDKVIINHSVCLPHFSIRLTETMFLFNEFVNMLVPTVHTYCILIRSIIQQYSMYVVTIFRHYVAVIMH